MTRGARQLRALLVAGPATDVDDVRRELGPEAFDVFVAVTLPSAASALKASPIEAVVVSPEAPVAWIDELLAVIDRNRPGIPVIVVRHRSAEEHAGWRTRGVGVLRQPLVPEALTRSIDAVLAMRKG